MNPSYINPKHRELLQYQGFLDCHPLWHGVGPGGLEQLEVDFTANGLDDRFSFEQKLPFGKRAERYFKHSLSGSRYDVAGENIQLVREGKTLGELDFLLTDRQTGEHIHVELICKFYLFDPDLGDDEISPWIGPNRKDSLGMKVDKLADHQLPVLQSPEGLQLLERLGWTAEKVSQRVRYLADIYLPVGMEPPTSIINPECVKGHWIRPEQLGQLAGERAEFILPEKYDWNVSPRQGEQWMDRNAFSEQLELSLERKRSPLVWMRDGTLFRRFFVVWW